MDGYSIGTGCGFHKELKNSYPRARRRSSTTLSCVGVVTNMIIIKVNKLK